MNYSRKDISSLKYTISSIKNRYEYIKKEVIETTTEEEYAKTLEHYDQLLDKFTQKLISLPIGFRYNGVFYIKRSYPVVPATFDRYEGVVYMREDLVSWQIEEGLERPDYGYHRNIFKEPKEGAELTRDDTIPVYHTPK